MYIDLLGYLLLLLIIAGGIYCIMAIFSVAGFFGSVPDRTQPNASPLPNVSLLKPLKGIDPGLRKNIQSFCDQDYASFETLLGLNRPDPKELSDMESIVESLGDRNVRIIVSDREIGVNGKVSNLQALSEVSQNPLLVLSDSDMRVDKNYLNTIVAEYQSEPNAGMVTCLYKITRPESIGAAFESLSIALDFLPSVLVARKIEGVSFGLGASMLIPRKVLDEIGGFREVADYLADDYQAGNRICKLGYRIIISKYVVEDIAGPMTFADYFGHQLRWARTIRVSRPAGFAGSVITHILPLSILLSLLWGFNPASVAVLVGVTLLRLATAMMVCTKVIKSAAWLKWLFILPAKDVCSFIIWLCAFCGSTVTWRGDKYRILKGGKVVKM